MGVQIQGDTGNVIATKGTYSGDVSIGGTLTYEDVTNIDSVGLITARSGLEIGARPGVAASVSVDGNAIFSGITTVGGNLMVGDNQIPDADLHVHGNLLLEDTIGNNLRVRSTVNNGNDPNIRFQKGRGGGTPAVVQNGDDTGDLSWAGYDGDSYVTGADILGEVDGTPADEDMPMRLTFKTRSAGAVQPQGRLRISADGTVSLENNSNLVIPDKIIHHSDTDTAIRFPAADTITAETGGSERLRILSSGGITFNGDTATANALDDYEVGDWTPALSQGSPSYVTQKGLYTKIGELVLCSFYIDYTNGSHASQRLTGLPFTPDTSRETINSVSRLGSAFNEDEGSGSRAMHSVSHTSQGSTYVYVDLLINAAAKGLRGTFMYRAV